MDRARGPLPSARLQVAHRLPPRVFRPRRQRPPPGLPDVRELRVASGPRRMDRMDGAPARGRPPAGCPAQPLFGVSMGPCQEPGLPVAVAGDPPGRRRLAPALGRAPASGGDVRRPAGAGGQLLPRGGMEGDRRHRLPRAQGRVRDRAGNGRPGRAARRAEGSGRQAGPRPRKRPDGRRDVERGRRRRRQDGRAPRPRVAGAPATDRHLPGRPLRPPPGVRDRAQLRRCPRRDLGERAQPGGGAAAGKPGDAVGDVPGARQGRSAGLQGPPPGGPRPGSGPPALEGAAGLRRRRRQGQPAAAAC